MKSRYRRLPRTACLLLLSMPVFNSMPCSAQLRARPQPSGTAAPAAFMGLPLSQLKAVDSGAGLVTCEPVVPAAFPADLADFGAGCSRWLQFVVGGQGELGKTPLWSEVDRAQLELNRPNLRFSLADAEQLQPVLGVTHGVVGTLEGTSEQLTLTYHLWQFTPRKEVGEPLTLRGTRSQILAQLPAMAAALCTRLGVKTLTLPPLTATAEELALMGRAASLSGFLYPHSLTEKLRALAGRQPLAGLLALRSDELDHIDDRVTSALSQQLLEQTPENPLAYGQVAKREPVELLPAGVEIKNLARRFPRNYAIAVIESAWQLMLENPEEAIRAGDRAVQCNVASPYSWMRLSYAASGLSEEDQGTRAQAADKAQQAAQQAVHLDPQNWYLWMHLLRVKTHTEKPEGIEAVAQKMLELDRADPDAIAWAMSVYDSQSPNGKAKRAQVAQHAVKTHYQTAYQSSAVASQLAGYGFSDPAKTVYDRSFAQFRALLAETPDNDQARLLFAHNLWNMQKWEEGLQEYKTLAQMRPNDATHRYLYANALHERHQMNEAIGEVEAALRIAPKFAAAFTLFGRCLFEKGEVDRAEQQFSAALRYDPRISEAHYGLGNVRLRQARYAEAATEYQTAIETLRTGWSARNAQEIMWASYLRLSQALSASGKIDSALEAAQTSLQINPENIETLNQLAAVYQKRKDWDKSIVVLTKALHVKPTDASAHEYMGNALIEKGQKTQARAEWKKALTLDTGKLAEEARQMLSKYPE